MTTRFEIASPVIERELAKPYRYGESDCFFLGCRVADAFDRGRRLGPSNYRAYKSLFGAQKALRRAGYRSLVDYFGDRLVRIGAASCRFGDLAILDLPDGEHVAVFTGQRFLTKTPAGSALFGLAFAAWLVRPLLAWERLLMAAGSLLVLWPTDVAATDPVTLAARAVGIAILAFTLLRPFSAQPTPEKTSSTTP